MLQNATMCTYIRDSKPQPWLRRPVPYPLGHWGFMLLESEAKFALSTYVTKFYSVY